MSKAANESSESEGNRHPLEASAPSPAIMLDYAPPRNFDAGKFVSRYLFLVACASVAAMIIQPIFFDRARIDISFILMFWASHAIRRHSIAARRWIIGTCGFVLAVSFVSFTGDALIIIEEMRLRGVQVVQAPAYWKCLGTIGLGAVTAVPFAILYPNRVRQDFEARRFVKSSQ